MKNLNDPFILLREAYAVWRVFLTLFAFQVSGGLTSLALGKYPGWFLNFWIGAASASVLGYGAGIIWHYFSPERRTHEHREIIILFGIITALLSAAAAYLQFGHGVIQTSFRQTMP